MKLPFDEAFKTLSSWSRANSTSGSIPECSKGSTRSSERLNTELLAQGYSVEEVESLRKKYESKYAQDCKAERAKNHI